MGKIVYPETVQLVVDKAKREGKLRFEYVGKIIDNCGFSIAEKMVVFWLDTGIVVFRAKAQYIGDFACLTYEEEKYPNHCGKFDRIIAEINELRKEYTSGIWCGNQRIANRWN